MMLQGLAAPEPPVPVGADAERGISRAATRRGFCGTCGGTRPLKSDIMSGMQIIRAVIIVFAVSAVALATSACPEKGPAEKAGEKIDNAVDKTKDAAKDATK